MTAPTDPATDPAAGPTAGRSVELVRDYPVGPARVFAAWTDPDQLEWFSGLPAAQSGPSVDLRPGGLWRVTLQEGPGGRRYATGGLYHVVDRPHRLEFSWGAPGGWPELDPAHPDTVPRITVTFQPLPPHGSGTRMTATLRLPGHLDDAQVAHWFDLGIRDGWTVTVDRLAGHLQTHRADAPR
ncbi:SRPBCC family protein [Kineococcus sp. SYSU DK001]|uniref:SRPBCC family protein n=1 Tax=Kineococcus sp. SYSU DK001 TaxID=3383122 RepID=UPI003D7E1A7F